MLILFLLLVLAIGLLGGAIYMLLEKSTTLKNALSEVEKLQHGWEEANDIITQRDALIATANNRANIILDEARQTAQRQLDEARQTVDAQNSRLLHLRQEYEKQENLNSFLLEKIAPLEERQNLYQLDFYEPHFNFEQTLDFERELNNIRKSQKLLISSGDAVRIILMVKEKNNLRLAKLLQKFLLRSFNSECDLFVKNVDYKNVVTYEKRIEYAFDQLNKWTAEYGVEISDEYLKLKLDELHIVYEYQEKKQDEAEEQRRIKEIMRDELKAEREMEKEKQKAEEEERQIQRLLDKIRENTSKAEGTELMRMNAQISVLQEQLEEAKQKSRALSQAQLTKSGYVYVISNIGSFGENVFKIGMTRRLEPQERIDELGDASVPFKFDVHAVIHCDNAPEMENKLHQHFKDKQINKINTRKEFFRCSLEEIAQAVQQYHGNVQFTMFAEAKEYRQSLALENVDRNTTI